MSKLAEKQVVKDLIAELKYYNRGESRFIEIMDIFEISDRLYVVIKIYVPINIRFNFANSRIRNMTPLRDDFYQIEYMVFA